MAHSKHKTQLQLRMNRPLLTGFVLVTAGYLLQGPDGGVKDKHTFEIILFACLALAAIAVSRIRRRRT